MLKNYLKCQSLGNDFILFDWLHLSFRQSEEVIHDSNWSNRVIKLCRRKDSIGADGVLVIRKTLEDKIEALIFNQDGTQAEKCLNGLRCVAYYLGRHKEQKDTVFVVMGNEEHKCSINNDEIEIAINKVNFQGSREIIVNETKYLGYIVDVGNPHLVIFADVDLSWLRENGKLFEQHATFSKRTNVEFVVGEKINAKGALVFDLLVYERGCGITMACGSGAAAVAKVLLKLKRIQTDQKFIIKMPGGELETKINSKQEIIQIAKAEVVYSGLFS